MKLTPQQQELLDALTQFDLPLRRDGDIDAKQYGAAVGITPSGAHDRLNKLVIKGQLATDYVRDPVNGGRPVRVWRAVDKAA